MANPLLETVASASTGTGDFWSAAGEVEALETAWTRQRGSLPGPLAEVIALGVQGSMVDDELWRPVDRTHHFPCLRYCFSIWASRWLSNVVIF